MAWALQKIEIELEKCLKREFKHSLADATKYFGFYTSARDKLIDDKIYDDIRTIRKGLSDHGPDHIMNVLSNAYDLLGTEIKSLDAMQLYFICMIILFHDVGNLTSDRSKHHEQDVIRQIYDYIRNSDRRFDEERVLVPEIASKHSGLSSDGSKDTIKELSLNRPYLFNKEIYSKKCAALLRLADELAEGPHRTSLFMNKYYNYPYTKNSVIYHKYAEIARTNIDKKGQRIVLTYTFIIPAKNGVISEKSHKEFVELFEFTIKRILKVEAERKYCKYYCDWLEPFKKTDVTFNYIIENIIGGKKNSKRINPGISQLVLDDLILPVKDTKEFFAENKDYDPEKVFDALKMSNEK